MRAASKQPLDWTPEKFVLTGEGSQFWLISRLCSGVVDKDIMAGSWALSCIELRIVQMLQMVKSTVWARMCIRYALEKNFDGYEATVLHGDSLDAEPSRTDFIPHLLPTILYLFVSLLFSYFWVWFFLLLTLGISPSFVLAALCLQLPRYVLFSCTKQTPTSGSHICASK